MSLVPAFCVWPLWATALLMESICFFLSKHSENLPTRKIISWDIWGFSHFAFWYFYHCVMCVCICVFLFVFLICCNLHRIFVWEILFDCFNSDDDHDNYLFNRFSTRQNCIWANICRGPRHVFARLRVLDAKTDLAGAEFKILPKFWSVFAPK